MGFLYKKKETWNIINIHEYQKMQSIPYLLETIHRPTTILAIEFDRHHQNKLDTLVIKQEQPGIPKKKRYKTKIRSDHLWYCQYIDPKNSQRLNKNPHSFKFVTNYMVSLLREWSFWLNEWPRTFHQWALHVYNWQHF